jgi:hypothetical protein
MDTIASHGVDNALGTRNAPAIQNIGSSAYLFYVMMELAITFRFYKPIIPQQVQ